MKRLMCCFLLCALAAAGQYFIEPGQAPPLPEPQPLGCYSYEPLGWNVLLPGCRVRTTDDGLRVRSEPLLSAEVLEHLDRGDEVVVQSIGPREVIGDREAWWYEVVEVDGGPILGWVYGGFLQPSQSGDWRDELRRAVELVYSGEVSAAHELLAGLPEDTPLTVLTEARHPALAVLYSLSVGNDDWWPVRLICGLDYGITMITDDQGDGFSRVHDDRWLVWDAGTWVLGPQYFADLTTGVVQSPFEPTGRAARHLGDGLFALLVYQHSGESGTESGWINAYAGTDADGYRSGVALYDGESCTLLLPEEQYYCWTEINGGGEDEYGPYFIVTGVPNRDPAAETLDRPDEHLFRVRFDPEAGRVTAIEPLE